MIIACVLKTGGWKNRHINVEYHPKQVIWLRDMVARFVKIDYRFVCFSDIEIPGVEVIPLTDNLPGWWSKLELLKRDYGKVFYLDLDTVIVKDITNIVKHSHKFTVLRNLSSKNPKKIGSGLMVWRGDHSYIYREFMKDPQGNMALYTTSERWGDQALIQDCLDGEFECFQDLFPAQVVSYKFDLGKGNPAPANRIVCFHGEPKPWETAHSWVPKM